MENLYHLITEDFRYGGNVGTQPTHSNWTNVPYNGGLIKEFWTGSGTKTIAFLSTFIIQ